MKIELKKELIKLNVNNNSITNNNDDSDLNTKINTANNTANNVTTANDIASNATNNKDIDNNVEIPLKESNIINSNIDESNSNSNSNSKNNNISILINTDNSNIDKDNSLSKELEYLATDDFNIHTSKWYKYFSPEHESFYYVNKDTGESQWDEPNANDDIEEHEHSMALYAESLVDANERITYDSNYMNENEYYDDDYNDDNHDGTFDTVLPSPQHPQHQEPEAYVYNSFNNEFVCPSAPPIPPYVVTNAIPLDTYLGHYPEIPELPISNVRRTSPFVRQNISPTARQNTSSFLSNDNSDGGDNGDDEEEFSSDDEVFTYNANYTVDQTLVTQLVEMGFEHDLAVIELNRCKNQIDVAIARLVRLNDRHSRNIRVIDKPKTKLRSAKPLKPVIAKTDTNTNTSANNTARTFLGQMIGVPKVPKVPINLFGSKMKNEKKNNSYGDGDEK